jgi:methyltransferase (TIGR00027 family)
LRRLPAPEVEHRLQRVGRLGDAAGTMRAGQRSRTSDWVAALRALYSEAPAELAIIDDPAAASLIPAGLATLVRASARLPLSGRALHRALGAASLGVTYGIPLRTAAIDEAVRKSVEERIEQLVLLGAGLDARAWRMPELERATVFELDHPATQAYKRERIGAFEPLARGVRHVPIDFEQQSISDALSGAGFASERPSVWIWEGVTMYLTQAAIDASLDAIAVLAAPGSRLAMTYIPPDYAGPLIRALGSLGSRLIGETLRGLIAPDDLERALGQRGFRIESDDSAPEWAARYWPSSERASVRAYERLAIAVRAGENFPP